MRNFIKENQSTDFGNFTNTVYNLTFYGGKDINYYIVKILHSQVSFLEKHFKWLVVTIKITGNCLLLINNDNF